MILIIILHIWLFISYIECKQYVCSSSSISKNILQKNAFVLTPQSRTSYLLCNGMHLKSFNKASIKDNYKAGQVILNFSNNEIAHLPEGCLSQISTTLISINFDNNSFVEIKTVYFRYCEQLSEISFANNKIKHIQENALIFTPKLTRIFMQNNRLKRIQHDLFINTKLNVLNFNDNNISHIGKTWQKLPLTNVSLARNKITKFYEHIFKRNNMDINIQGNNFQCGCDLKWILNYNLTINYLPNYNVKCNTDDIVQNFSIVDFIDDESKVYNNARDFLADLTCPNDWEGIKSKSEGGLTTSITILIIASISALVAISSGIGLYFYCSYINDDDKHSNNQQNSLQSNLEKHIPDTQDLEVEMM